MSEKPHRSFRIVTIDNNAQVGDGTYHGRGPGQAALKAFNWYCRKTDLKTCNKRFTIEEITRGKTRKQFHYVGSRSKLSPPKTVIRRGAEYIVQYKTSVHKVIQ